MRYIVAAAVQVGEVIVSVPRPGRHHDVMQKAVKAGFPAPVRGEQGFLTNEGEFVDRYEGLRIAGEAEQIVEKHGNPDKLFSEDMW